MKIEIDLEPIGVWLLAVAGSLALSAVIIAEAVDANGWIAAFDGRNDE